MKYKFFVKLLKIAKKFNIGSGIRKVLVEPVLKNKNPGDPADEPPERPTFFPRDSRPGRQAKAPGYGLLKPGLKFSETLHFPLEKDGRTQVQPCNWSTLSKFILSSCQETVKGQYHQKCVPDRCTSTKVRRNHLATATYVEFYKTSYAAPWF
jgi:hypothetical protein